MLIEHIALLLFGVIGLCYLLYKPSPSIAEYSLWYIDGYWYLRDRHLNYWGKFGFSSHIGIDKAVKFKDYINILNLINGE